MNLLEELHNRFKPYERISPVLVMRYTKLNYEACKMIRDKLMEIRQKEKEMMTPKRKKWERIK